MSQIWTRVPEGELSQISSSSRAWCCRSRLSCSSPLTRARVFSTIRLVWLSPFSSELNASLRVSDWPLARLITGVPMGRLSCCCHWRSLGLAPVRARLTGSAATSPQASGVWASSRRVVVMLAPAARVLVCHW
ncbi:hypothetical protein D3C79_795620 [compost metagenome]